MIGITLGEHQGIGAEIVAKSLHDHPDLHPHVTIFGSRNHLTQTFQTVGISMPDLHVHDIPIVEKPSADQRARYVLDMLDTAIAQAKTKKIQSMVTAPIDKAIVAHIDPNFSGHTGYLAQKSGVPQTVMIMQNTDYRILVGTQHIPLRDVHHVFTKSWLEQQLIIAIDGLQKHFNIKNPKIALLGLNPHAGEIDPQSEEKQWMQQAVQDWQTKMNIQGPFPADSFFGQAKNQGWDLVVSPYHDQALVAAKYNGVQDAINITLGLDYLRTSPGHGVAYDLAGQGKADPRSFDKAFLLAAQADVNIK